MNKALKPTHREQAKTLYWRGHTVQEIADLLGEKYNTVSTWKKRDKWQDINAGEKIAICVQQRLAILVEKENKAQRDFLEMEALGKLLERTARVKKYSQGGNEADLNPRVKNRNKARKAKQNNQQNFLTEEDIEKLIDRFNELIFDYQREWHKHGKQHTIRQYLKSRQIGATFYFSMEACLSAVVEGRNQIFISASKAQAHVFKRNIINFVRDTTGKQLKGDPIIFGHNGAELHFLGTNKNTAQSYSGDLYIDEYFWIPKFKDIELVASGMAVHDDRRVTYFSTPSIVTHEAYPLWTGEHYNVDRPRDEHVHFEVTHKALKNGRLCEDGIFRQMITIEDAISKGLHLVTMDKLRKKFAPSKMPQLFFCKFINDEHSVFSFAEMQSCMVDSIDFWKDFNPLAGRPLGDDEVWIGYDPSRSGDAASMVVIAPPKTAKGKFRILERFSYYDMDFDKQAKRIKSVMMSYNVTHIAIDATGMGNGVYELVRKFFPRVEKIIYNVEIKNTMVLKAKQLVSNKRLQMDAGMRDIAEAFLTIHPESTNSGRQITYRASRTKKTGHADLAWAVMHALNKVQLQSIDTIGTQKTQSFFELF